MFYPLTREPHTLILLRPLKILVLLPLASITRGKAAPHQDFYRYLVGYYSLGNYQSNSYHLLRVLSKLSTSMDGTYNTYHLPRTLQPYTIYDIVAGRSFIGPPGLFICFGIVHTHLEFSRRLAQIDLFHRECNRIFLSFPSKYVLFKSVPNISSRPI